jgi:hypothetical protein
MASYSRACRLCLLRSRQLCQRQLCPPQHLMRWAQPMKQLFRSKVGMGMGMGGATTTVGTAATTIAGGIIAIGGDFHLGSTAWRLGDIA